MNTSESADELVKICIDGIDRMLRVTGIGVKNIAIMLIALSKEKTQTKGKTRLTSMLKTGKPLDIFTIRAEDLKKFSQEARKYGILYCALANKKNDKIDGMVDIMVREEDGAKLNRISERFNFRDVAKVREEFEKSKQDKLELNASDKLKSEDKQFIDNIMPKSKEQKELPSNTKTVEKSQSEISSNTKLLDKVEIFKENKKSVKQELEEITREIKQKEKQNLQTENTKAEYKSGKYYKGKEEKHKGKRYKEPKHLASKNRTKGRS